jgi:hypothetical protein
MPPVGVTVWVTVVVLDGHAQRLVAVLMLGCLVCLAALPSNVTSPVAEADITRDVIRDVMHDSAMRLLAANLTRLMPLQWNETFASAADLEASVWGGYFDHIYGIATMRFPFSLSELGFFNARLLPPDIKASLVIRVQPFQRVELVERASKIIRPYGAPLIFGVIRLSL